MLSCNWLRFPYLDSFVEPGNVLRKPSVSSPTLVIVLKWHHPYHDYLDPILKISSYERESDKITIAANFNVRI